MDREMGVECLLLGGLGNDAQMPGLRLPSPVQSAHPDLPYHNVSEKAMATHSRTLAWRMPGMGEPGGLPSMGSHRVRHDWSNLAAAAATHVCCKSECHTQVHLIPGEAQEYSSLPLRVPIQPVLEAVTSGGQHCKVVRTGWRVWRLLFAGRGSGKKRSARWRHGQRWRQGRRQGASTLSCVTHHYNGNLCAGHMQERWGGTENRVCSWFQEQSSKEPQMKLTCPDKSLMWILVVYLTIHRSLEITHRRIQLFCSWCYSVDS